MKTHTTSKHIRLGLLLLMASAQTLQVMPAETLSQSILSNWTREKSIGALGISALVIAGGYYAWQQHKKRQESIAPVPIPIATAPQQNLHYTEAEDKRTGVTQYTLDLPADSLEPTIQLIQTFKEDQNKNCLRLFGEDPVSSFDVNSSHNLLYNPSSYVNAMGHIHFKQVSEVAKNPFSNDDPDPSMSNLSLQACVTSAVHIPLDNNLPPTALHTCWKSNSVGAFHILTILPNQAKAVIVSNLYKLPIPKNSTAPLINE